MKNIIHNIDKSNIITKTTNEAIFNCTISSKEGTKKYNSNTKIIKKNIFSQKKINNEKNNMEDNNKINLLNKINLNNDFLINSIIFKNDYCLDWPNSLNSLNDMMSSTADLSLKEDNNLENCSNNIEIENPDNITGNKINFSIKNQINDYDLCSNNLDEQNIDLDNNEDCCSKMTNLYVQEFEDKKMMDYLLE